MQQQNGMVLRYASDTLKNDRDVVLAAVQHYGMVLHYASANLRNDQDIVLAAVQQHGDALQYASDGLRNDQGVVLVAVQQHGKNGAALCLCQSQERFTYFGSCIRTQKPECLV